MEPKRGRPPHPGAVTPAEAKVLELVRQGLPNAEIAVRLGVSVNTVRYHVSNLLAKANATDRAQLKHWRPRPEQSDARNWGWVALILKPKLAVAASLAAGAVAAIAITASVATIEPAEPVARTVEPPAPFQGAVVGELIRQGDSLAVIESGTGQAFVLTDSLNFDRYVGQVVFILGEIDGRKLAPTAGSAVGARSRCAGVLSEANGTISIGGGCGGMEVVDLSLDQVIAYRSERVMVNVPTCAQSTGGRLSSPQVSLYGSEIEPRC